MRVLYERDADASLIKAKRVAVIGYGAQGHAHALNLRDSGVDVVVALHAAARRAEQARADGFAPITVTEAAKTADVLVMCAPDEVMPDLYAAEIAPRLRCAKLSPAAAACPPSSPSRMTRGAAKRSHILMAPPSAAAAPV